MTECPISEAARRTGFTPATLRYYEQIDLLRPARSPNGYRCYSDAALDLLRFVGRAKKLGISLGEIRELLAGRRADDCRRVRGQLASAVAARLDETEELIVELTTFRDQLRVVHDELGARPASERCGPGCGCEVEVKAIEPPAGRALALVILTHGTSRQARGDHETLEQGAPARRRSTPQPEALTFEST